MKNFLLFTVFLFLIHTQTIAQQSTAWHWAKSVAGTSGNAITTDVFGNVYVTGAYSGTISFGTTTLSNSAGGGMYLVKYDALGNVLWAKTHTGTGGTMGYGISTDMNGNVFVTGEFSSTSSYPVIFGAYTLTSTMGSIDMFIVKFDLNGYVLWAKSAGGTDMDGGYSVSTDNNGNSFVTGYFRSTSLTIGTYTLINQTSGAGSNVFTAEYDPNGNVLWAKAAVGTNTNLSVYGKSISTDVNGNALVTGYFRASSIIFGTYTLTDAGGVQLFVVKYDPNGNVLWAKAAGGTMFDFGSAVSTDVNGNVFLTGSFQSPSIVFGTYTLSNANTPTPNIFVAKYNASGDALWAKALGDGEGVGICTDAGGNTFAIGYYNSPTMVFGTSTLANNGQDDIFIVKYDASGNEISAVSVGGSSNDYGRGIATDGSGNVFVTGYYSSPSVAFGSIILSNTNTNTNYYNVFVGRLQLCNPCLGVADITSPMSTLLVYPNPFQDKLLIDSGELRIDKLSISNVLGELILQQNNYNASQALDLSGLPSGIYFLKVEREKEQRVIKVIKE